MTFYVINRIEPLHIHSVLIVINLGQGSGTKSDLQHEKNQMKSYKVCLCFSGNKYINYRVYGYDRPRLDFEIKIKL